MSNYIHGQQSGTININIAMNQLYKTTPPSKSITTKEEFLNDILTKTSKKK